MEDLAKRLTAAQLQRAELENEKLTLELAKLRKSTPWYQLPLQLVPMTTAVVSLAGFFWGVNLYFDAQEKEAEGRKAQAAREILDTDRELMKPWLESQRETYGKALDAATEALLSSDAKQRATAANDFWQLYYGRMVLVETKSVSGAMKQVGYCLNDGARCDPDTSRKRLLALATSMAQSMSNTAKLAYADFAGNQFRYEPPGAPGSLSVE